MSVTTAGKYRTQKTGSPRLRYHCLDHTADPEITPPHKNLSISESHRQLGKRIKLSSAPKEPFRGQTLSDVLFKPTIRAKNNPKKIILFLNTKESLECEFKRGLTSWDPILGSHPVSPHKGVLEPQPDQRLHTAKQDPECRRKSHKLPFITLNLL